MTWVVYTLVSAFSLSTADALTKKSLLERNEYVIAWVRLVFALPYLLIALVFIPFPPLDQTFWLTVLVMLPLELVALILYMKAIKTSPLSLTIPFLAFTPLFLILSGRIILGERPGMGGISGILLIAAGAYALHLHTASSGWLSPFRAIAKEKGSVLMIVVAFLYSITSALGKVAIQHSHPVFFGAVYYLLLTVISTPLAMAAGAGNGEGLRATHKKDLFLYVPIGFCIAVMIIFHTLAIIQTQAAYMVAVKRLNLLGSVIYGHLLFKEGPLGERMLGSVLMIMGVALIALSG